MFWKRLPYLLPWRRRAAEADMREELRSIAAMAQPGELGNLTVVAENARAEWGWTRLDVAGRDLRYAVRTLGKSQAFTAIAVLSLGLGIGANTALFSLIDALLLRPLAVAAPDRLVSVERVGIPFNKGLPLGPPRLLALDALHDIYGGAAAAAPLGRPVITVDGQVEPNRVAMQATGSFFRVLGVEPAIGRIESTTPGVVLGHRYWQSRFDGGAAVLTRTIAIDGAPHPILGVTAPGFGGLSLDASVDVWLIAPPSPVIAAVALARMKPGVTVAQAHAATDALFLQLDRQLGAPALNGVPIAARTDVLPAGQGTSALRSQYETPLLALMALVALVLLMTCTNIGSLVVVRNTRRARELAVRTALGASRARLVAQLTAESLVLALAGGALAWLFASWGVSILLSMLPVAEVPEQLQFRTDGRLLAFMAATSLMSAALFTIAPAWRATSISPGPALAASQPSASGRGSRRVGWLFVAGQTALSVVLLSGACLFFQSARNAMAISSGFNPRGVLQVELDRDWARAVQAQGKPAPPLTVDQVRAAYAELERRLSAIPGVTAITSFWLPLLPPDFAGVPQPAEPLGAFAGPGFFETLQIPILRGRGLTDEDARRRQGAAVVISESFARLMFPGEDAVGRRIDSVRLRNGNWMNLEVVGVAGDARLNNLRWADDPTIYMHGLTIQRAMTALQIRTHIDPAHLAAPVRQALLDMNPRSVVSMRPLEDVIARSIARERMVAGTSLFLALVGLVLACIGVFGVAAGAVAERTREIGLRIALGATSWNVIRGTLFETTCMFGLGLLAGTLAAVAVAQWLDSRIAGMLLGLSATDWTNFTAAVAIVMVAGVTACLTPAIRAIRIDPLIALRHD